MPGLDIERFWEDDEKAHEDNCFSKDAPQAAMAIRMSDECVFAELDEPGKPWLPMDRERRMELNRRYNDKAEKIVGRRLLSEYYPTEDECFPEIKKIGEVFEGRYVANEISIWLEGSVKTPLELDGLLDRVERTDIRDFILPENWHSEKKRIFEKYGKRPNQVRSVRGPVTLATSLFGVENLIFLIIDEPDLAKRFSKIIADVIIAIMAVMDEEAGYTAKNSPHGFRFYDDDCNLLTPEMYALFGYPVLRKVFDYSDKSPLYDRNKRYQHSDSAMSHLLPQLADFNLTGSNFGPTVTVDEIRKHMPNTRIDGQLAPFTFMRNNEEEIIAEVRRDCDAARKTKGLNVMTAGSINNGSLLRSMRTIMATIQNFGRYD
ncbi:MAG TPA: uroporphyrinogen decarboxylase family protein [Clostridia bacterium]|nr:uroporphyrinogen decarboxylase family protein [Clostridia bacterium]